MIFSSPLTPDISFPAMLSTFRALPLSPFSFQRRFFAAAIFAAATLILLRYFRLPPLPYAFDDIIIA
jgi:hypothetical protein